MIGGRRKWLEYISESQIRWEVVGFQITFTWLISLVGSLITAAFSTIMIQSFVQGDGGGDSN